MHKRLMQKKIDGIFKEYKIPPKAALFKVGLYAGDSSDQIEIRPFKGYVSTPAMMRALVEELLKSERVNIAIEDKQILGMPIQVRLFAYNNKFEGVDVQKFELVPARPAKQESKVKPSNNQMSEKTTSPVTYRTVRTAVIPRGALIEFAKKDPVFKKDLKGLIERYLNNGVLSEDKIAEQLFDSQGVHLEIPVTL